MIELVLVIIASIWVIALGSAGVYVGVRGIISTYQYDRRLQNLIDKLEKFSEGAAKKK